MDDVWDLARAYDKTVPSSVKNATGMSSEVLQMKKQAWLDNRRLLRDFIKENSGEAKKAFSKMHDFLSVADDLSTRGLELKGAPGVLHISPAIKSVLKTGGGVAGGILGAGWAGKKAGLFDF